MVVTAKLNNSLLGWMLVATSEEAKPAVAQLYGGHRGYDDFTSGERAFMKGEPVEAAKAHVKTVADRMGIGLSYCGSGDNPTVRIWFDPVTVAEPEELRVDLKWSCWTTDKGIWDEYAPGVWDRMAAAFNGTAGPVRVMTGPRKETRYGSVLVSKGGAEGHFVCMWDELNELADTLNTEADDAFAETIPFSSHSMEPGMDRDFDCKARKFERLMRRIDAEEDGVIGESDAEWQLIESLFNRE